MRLVEKLPPKWRSLAEEIIKFGMIGGVNTVVNLAIFNLLLFIGPLKSNLVAAVVATTVSYFLNRHWTYRHLPKTTLRREYSLFFFFNVIGLCIEMAFLGLAKYGMHYSEHSDFLAFNMFKFAGLALGTAFRFWAYRTFVFGAGKTAEPEPVAEAPVSPAPAGAAEIPVEAEEAAEAVDEAFAEVLAADALDEPEPADTTPSRRLR